MKNKKKKTKFSKTMLALVLLAIVTVVISMIFMWIPFFKTSPLYSNAQQLYRDNTWNTFTSSRAQFSFKHPLSWPVSSASDEQLREINQDFVDGKWIETYNEIENIDFQEEWIRNAGGPRLGFIIVQKTDYKNLQEYVDDISKEKVVDLFVKGASKKVTITPPKIEYLKIGGVDAIGVTETNNLAAFVKQIDEYRLIRNGWLYRFATVDSSRYLEDEEKNAETFYKMIESVKFHD